MADKEWLASLEPGSEVVLFPGGLYDRPRIDEITHITAMYADVGCMRLRISDGRGIGSAPWRIEQPTAENRELVERASLIGRICRIKASWLERTRSTDQLRRIVAILDEPKQSGASDG